METPFEDHPQSSTKDIWDVAVIGAGPAGACAAFHLAARGHRVLLLDRFSFPREKTCGDALAMDSLQRLEAMGLGDRVRSRGYVVNRARIFSPSRIEIEIPAEYVMIQRSLLDAMIVERAVEKGAIFQKGNVQNIVPEKDNSLSILCRDNPRKISARFCVIATGTRLGLFKKFKVVPHRTPEAIGARCYVESSYPLVHLIFAHERCTPQGYGWIFPMGENKYNVGVGSFYGSGIEHARNLKKYFQDFLAEFPISRELLNKGAIISPLSIAPLRYGMKGTLPVLGENILVAGETIGTTLPFTGEGIGPALHSAEIAARVLDKALSTGNTDCLKEYPQILEEEMRHRYRWLSLAEKMLRGKWFDLLWLLAQRNKPIHRKIVSITLGHDVPM